MQKNGNNNTPKILPRKNGFIIPDPPVDLRGAPGKVDPISLKGRDIILAVEVNSRYVVIIFTSPFLVCVSLAHILYLRPDIYKTYHLVLND